MKRDIALNPPILGMHSKGALVEESPAMLRFLKGFKVSEWNAPAVGKWMAALLAAQWMTFPGQTRGALTTLVILMGIDIITGMWASAVNGTISSDAGFRGVSRKIAMLCFLLVAHLIEHSVGIELNVEFAGALAYSINESISIIENFYRLNVPIPATLVAALLQAKKLRFDPATTDQMRALKERIESDKRKDATN